MAEKLLNIKEVAEYLGVSVRTVQSYVYEQDPELKLNGIYLGNRWRFEEKDLTDFIERRRRYGTRVTEERKPEEPAVA